MKTNLSLYIHIPFCIRKCRYCDFLSGPADVSVHEQYVSRLEKEIISAANGCREYRVVTVYFGGGTPSILSADSIVRLVEVIHRNFDVAQDAELTIEINPGTVDADKLQAYRNAGINRLSIGLQSALNKELCLLGRIHTIDEFESTYRTARKIGFNNINIDLMSALPGQSKSDYLKSLQYVCDLQPEHISSYSFQLEEDTWFWNHQEEFDWPSEELDRELYELTENFLSKAGYERYEISNYSLPGYESRHNSVYWMRDNYWGFGLGASSLMNNVRYKNTEDMSEYLSGIYRVECEELTTEAQMEEFLFLGLRLMRGVSVEAFESLFGVDIQRIYGDIIDDLVNKELLEYDDKRTALRFTRRGIDVSNYCLAQFIMD